MEKTIKEILHSKNSLFGISWSKNKYAEHYFYIRKNESAIEVIYNKEKDIEKKTFNIKNEKIEEDLFNYINNNFNIPNDFLVTYF